MSWLNFISPHIHELWKGPWNPGQIEAARRIYDHELVVVTKGLCKVEIKGQEILLEENSFIIIPPDSEHLSLAMPDKEVFRYCIHFDWSFQKDWLDNNPIYVYSSETPQKELFRSPPDFVPDKLFYGKVKHPVEINSLLQSIFFHWFSDTNQRTILRAVLLQILLLLLSEPVDKNKATDSQLAFQVKDLLDMNIEANVSIQSLLETSGFSYAHLARIFKKKFGISPLQYLNTLKIEKAKILLVDPTRFIGDVADSLGFNNHCYFTKLFHRHTGISPRDYVKNKPA